MVAVCDRRNHHVAEGPVVLTAGRFEYRPSPADLLTVRAISSLVVPCSRVSWRPLLFDVKVEVLSEQ